MTLNKIQGDAPIIVTERGAVLEIRINRPHKRNSLTQEAVDLLGAAYEKLEANDFAVGLVYGTGDAAFCAGADFNTPRKMIPAPTRTSPSSSPSRSLPPSRDMRWEPVLFSVRAATSS
ncbi:hypothetical protein EJ997_01895 [Flaviflexus ciconiae]|uniref:Enoyl-CoA hydratase/isomerase family protein n=1 Tax=Flaviflexus ciconiae TaxID=2496867 RepID=A0A3S9PVA8_9ACTO|nr:enoyl-CoA hydratase-related protein [Flaviflexus ciconiae]AZQ76275.1 hypothetical protein EJ997_01895 [Flaviflexus ciconiae]